jgi:hypothetical protein
MLLNGAGVSAADPTLKNLSIEFVFAASSMDVASLVEAWIDTTNSFPGTNSVKSSLSPAATVLTSGAAGTYDDTTKQYALGSTTGLSVGDYYYLSHASLTAGVFKIATIPDGTHVTIVGNPLNGLGNKTGIAYQVGWRYLGVLGTSPLVSSGGGQINYFKVRAQDSAANQTDAIDNSYIRDAPSGANYIAIGGKTYDGTDTTNTLANTLAILSAWTNKGGVSHVELANHSVEAVNNFTWTTGGGTAEKTISAAESSGLTLSAGDGIKYGQLRLKDASGGQTVNVDIAINVDTGAPTIVMSLVGR